MRFAVLSNVNLNPLLSSLKDHEIYFGGYGQYIEEMISGESALHQKKNDVLFLHLDGEEFIKEFSQTLLPAAQAQAVSADKLHLIFSAVSSYVKRDPGVCVVLSTVALAPFVFCNYLDVNAGTYPRHALEGWINGMLIEFAQKTRGIYILDWRGLVAAGGYRQMVSEKFWYLGRIRYSSLGYQSMAEGLKNLVKAIHGQTKKVLVLDLDNTLWGGILGEDGIDCVQLSEEGIGKAYRDFQREIKSLTQTGVLLAVNSRNNWEDAAKMFAEHPMMILKKEDFVNIKVNWNDKVDNMKSIAGELKLGLESFVFIDDNPRERAMIQESLPQIEVPDFPRDPVLLKGWFLETVVYPQFPKVFLTDEDHSKVNQYKAAGKRDEMSKELSLETFIKHLEIKIEIHVNDRRLIQRTAQLTQKTNQFNLTTNRYSESQIAQYLEGDGMFVFNLDYRDRFGQEGVVGAAIVRIQEQRAQVDTFLLSCRVIGRHVEYAFFYQILKYLKGRGVAEIQGSFVSTAKNKVAEGFYPNAGLISISRDQDKEDFFSPIEGAMDCLWNKYQVGDFAVLPDEFFNDVKDKVEKHG